MANNKIRFLLALPLTWALSRTPPTFGQAGAPNSPKVLDPYSNSAKRGDRFKGVVTEESSKALFLDTTPCASKDQKDHCLLVTVQENYLTRSDQVRLEFISSGFGCEGMISPLRCICLSALMISQIPLNCVGQRTSDLRIVESPPAFNPQGGSLNIVLANPRGFVIATDSRRTGRGKTADDSQKLFRLGKTSALAISGFACNLNRPFTTSIAGDIEASLNGYTDESADKWVENTVARSLPVLRLIGWAEGISSGLGVSVLLAHLDHPSGVPEIMRLTIGNGPAQKSTYRATHFLCIRAGVTDVVDAVIDGRYVGDDRTLLRFEHAGAQTFDKLPVREMAALARAFIRETARYYDEVGGPVQLGTFEVRGPPQWAQGVFPRPMPTFGAIMNVSNSTNWAPPITPAIPAERLTLVSNSLFSEQTIFVDGNVFVSNSFYRCVLRLQSDMPLYWRKNRCGSSYMTVPNSNILVPLGPECLPISGAQ